MYGHSNPDLLTSGVLDAMAIEAFCRGACAALALAIHRSTNWPVDHADTFADAVLGKAK